MIARIKILWSAMRDSLWFLPSLMTLIAAIVAIGLVQFESHYGGKFWEGRGLGSGSVEGARAVLSTIAGSLITVTGVAFSVTIVALQLASSQFTPRILRNFMADRSNQVVLGVLIATFTYTLLVLRVIRATSSGGEFVPQISVSVAIVLSLVSIGFLIYFIHHAARSIQASVILETITRAAMEQVDALFPEEIGRPAEPGPAADDFSPHTAHVVAAHRTGYLQAVDGTTLFSLGAKQKVVIQMVQPIGAFILEEQPLALVRAAAPLDEATQRAVRRAFVLGEERTPEHDLEFFLIEISDMAVKALSPGINDPTTAIHCIDRLTQILLALGKRRPPAPRRTESGAVHFLALPTTFERAIELAFEQILHFGQDNPAIVARLTTAFQVLFELLPVERHPPLAEFCRRLPNAPLADAF